MLFSLPAGTNVRAQGILPDGRSAAPEHAAATFDDEIRGLVHLDSRAGGIRVAVSLIGLPDDGVRVVGSTGRCLATSGATTSLGFLRPERTRAAVSWVASPNVTLRSLRSVRLQLRGALLACARLVPGDRQADGCTTLPDGCDGTVVVPDRVGGALARGILMRATLDAAGAAQLVVARVSTRIDRVILGTGLCSVGGGDVLATVALRGDPGLAIHEVAPRAVRRLRSFRIVGSGTACVDVTRFSVLRPPR